MHVLNDQIVLYIKTLFHCFLATWWVSSSFLYVYTIIIHRERKKSIKYHASSVYSFLYIILYTYTPPHQLGESPIKPSHCAFIIKHDHKVKIHIIEKQALNIHHFLYNIIILTEYYESINKKNKKVKLCEAEK